MARGGGAVAAGAPRLLHPLLERARQPGVHHQSHIRLVNPHTERHRRRHHAQLPTHESRVHALPLLLRTARVVVVGLQPRAAQRRSQLLALVLAHAVDDRTAAAAALCPLAHQLDDARHPRVFGRAKVAAAARLVAARLHQLGGEGEVGAVRRVAQLSVGRKSQRRADRLDGAHRGGGGEAEDGGDAEVAERRTEGHVRRPEVV